MRKKALMVDDETRNFLLEDLKKHIEVTYPLLEDRVFKLENRHAKIESIQERVVKIETQIATICGKVDSLGVKVESFTKEIRDEFHIFTTETRNLNTSFIRWLIGTVLISLILGLWAQSKAFQDVHDSIHTLDKKVTEIVVKEETIKQQQQKGKGQ